MTPLDGDAKGWSKDQALARGERRYRRKIASPKRWQAISDAKQGPCRVCQAPPPNQLHHTLSRAQGGSDTESAIVPLCAHCHRLVEDREPAACRALLVSLTDAEYSWLVEVGGEDVMSRRYGLTYERV